MQNALNPVVVLGGGSTGVRIAKSFGRRGIDVYFLIDLKAENIYSKYCKRCFFGPGTRYNQDLLKRALKKIRRSLNAPAVVFPTCDFYSLNLAQIRDELKEDYYCVVGDKESVATLVKKKEFYKTLAENKIPHPTTYFPEGMKDVEQIGSEIHYPVFIKPSISPMFTAAFGTKGFVVHSKKELLEGYQLATNRDIEVVIQEIIQGPESNSFQLEGYYNKDSRPTILFARQRMRIWPEGFGNTTLCVSIPLTKVSKEIEMINRFIKNLGYQGLMSAEFKRDPKDGILKLLEINARTWWHFWLSEKCGADIIFTSYMDLIGKTNYYLRKYKVGLKSLYFLLDLKASSKGISERTLNISDWILSLRNTKVEAFFSLDDPSPFFMNIMLEVLKALRKH
jgi:predicted ATP-grasp superfamily ATP-dependent carboligase